MIFKRNINKGMHNAQIRMIFNQLSKLLFPSSCCQFWMPTQFQIWIDLERRFITFVKFEYYIQCIATINLSFVLHFFCVHFHALVSFSVTLLSQRRSPPTCKLRYMVGSINVATLRIPIILFLKLILNWNWDAEECSRCCWSCCLVSSFWKGMILLNFWKAMMLLKYRWLRDLNIHSLSSNLPSVKLSTLA